MAKRPAALKTRKAFEAVLQGGAPSLEDNDDAAPGRVETVRTHHHR
jgi:hypothetical protein